jgi:hypothetical protein
MARGLFGERPAGAVTIVETPISRSYARKARMTFYGVAFALSTTVSAALATAMHPARAIVLGIVAGVPSAFALAGVVRVWPVLRVLWHWSTEIVVAGGLTAGSMWSASAIGWGPTSVFTVVVALVLAAVGPVRRRLMALIWCGMVRHRLRVCFAEFIRAANRIHPGRLPLLLLARPTPAGERVWLWLRPGLDLSDLETRANKLAVACWASEVRVVRASTRFAALMRVDVTRRDPLSAVVPSPLAALVPAPGSGTAPVPARAWVGLDLPEVPEEVPDAPRVGGRR